MEQELSPPVYGREMRERGREGERERVREGWKEDRNGGGGGGEMEDRT